MKQRNTDRLKGNNYVRLAFKCTVQCRAGLWLSHHPDDETPEGAKNVENIIWKDSFVVVVVVVVVGDDLNPVISFIFMVISLAQESLICFQEDKSGGLALHPVVRLQTATNWATLSSPSMDENLLWQWKYDIPTDRFGPFECCRNKH